MSRKKAVVCLLLGVGLLVSVGYSQASKEEAPQILVSSAHSGKMTPGLNNREMINNSVKLEVPLLNQMDAPRLYNGCEVTSLAMVLNYEGYDVTKNELAEKIAGVPLTYENGTSGNPNSGFVGNMPDGPGLGVYHGPIFNLAKKYAGERVENLTGRLFSQLLNEVRKGSPVWVLTTASLSPHASFQTWNTPQGPVEVTFQMHSVVITGFDKESIYVNDPYGQKDRKVDRDQFIASWELMGSQAVVIH